MKQEAEVFDSFRVSTGRGSFSVRERFSKRGRFGERERERE